MFTPTKQFLHWHFPYLGAIEELFDQLGQLSPSQLEHADVLNQPLKPGEARFLRIDAVLRWVNRKLELPRGVSPLHAHYDTGHQRFVVSMPTRHSVGRLPVGLPKSVDDYIMCRSPVPIGANLNRVETVAVHAVARHEGITAQELVKRATLEYLVQHGVGLVVLLNDPTGAGCSLADELMRLGVHPAEFLDTYGKVSARVVRNQPVVAS